MRLPPGSTLTDTLFPDTTRFRSPVSSGPPLRADAAALQHRRGFSRDAARDRRLRALAASVRADAAHGLGPGEARARVAHRALGRDARRSEEHTSELQSLMRISYAVFCLKKKKKNQHTKE